MNPMNVFVEFAATLFLAFLVAITIALVARQRKIFVSASGRALSPRVTDGLFWALFIAFVLIFGSLSILRHESFHSGGFDVGIFDQVVWNSLHGRLFENSIRIDATSFLAQHFSPFLLALVPLYVLWSDPRALLIIQTLALAVAGFPIYWFARRELGRGLALAIAAAYYLFPSLQYVNLFEFHEIALAVPLLSFSIFFLLGRRYVPFLASLLLALLTKEEIAFVLVALGMYLFLIQNKRWMGFALSLFGIVYALVVFMIVIPFFFGKPYDANFFIMDRYAYLGKTFPEIILAIVTQPGLVIQHLLVPMKIEFVLQLLVPLVFVPLVGGEVFALALPTLGYLLIGDDVYQNSINYQYTAPLIPVVFFALVIGLKRVSAWSRVQHLGESGSEQVGKALLGTLVIAASLINYLFQAAGPLSLGFDPSQYTMNARVALGQQLIAQIPPDVPTMVEANLVPHLSERRFIYQPPNAPDLRPIEYLLADTRFGPYQEYKSIWDDVLTSPYFQTIVEQDGYILKKRAPYTPATPLAIQYDHQITLLGYTIESSLPAQRGETVAIVLEWRADQTIHQRFVIFIHLLDAQNHIWAQGDREPANGWFRTDHWMQGDVTPDRYQLELDAPMPPGNYPITAGLYAVDTQKRSSARDNSGNDLGDEPVIATLSVK